MKGEQNMKHYYHGTTVEAAKSIISNGFDGATDTVWNCSNSDLLYVRDKELFEEDEAKYLCVESGQIAAAVTDSKETSIIVFEFLVPDEVAEKYFEEDDSCENMDGCFQIDRDELTSLVERGTIQVRVYEAKDAYIPYLRVFYISGLISNRNMTINDDLLYRACETVAKSDACAYLYEDLFGFNSFERKYVSVFEQELEYAS